MAPETCSFVRLCPARQVLSANGSSGSVLLSTAAGALDISLRGARRAEYSRTVQAENGMMLVTEQLTLEVDDPALTHTLRHAGYRWWVAELTLSDGTQRLFGSKQFPAEISFSGTDTNDTITLIAISTR